MSNPLDPLTMSTEASCLCGFIKKVEQESSKAILEKHTMAGARVIRENIMRRRTLSTTWNVNIKRQPSMFAGSREFIRHAVRLSPKTEAVCTGRRKN